LGDWLSSEGGDVSRATTSNDHTDFVAVTGSLVLCVSVALAMTNIEGEHVELVVVYGVIEDLVVIVVGAWSSEEHS
jgi:Holliday junction resolvase